MRQLSLTDTQKLVDSFVKTFGQRGAARKLTEHGYRSPEGHDIRQGHISRVQAGSWTCFMAPEEPAKATIPAPAQAPIALRPPVALPYPDECLELTPPSSPLVAEEYTLEDLEGMDSNEVRRQLREELEAEEADRQEKELNLPPFVPAPGDHTTREHSHLQRDVRVSAVFNRRGPVELDEDRGDFFGIPRLARQPPKTITKPYEPRSYAQLSTSPTEPYRLQSKKS